MDSEPKIKQIKLGGNCYTNLYVFSGRGFYSKESMTAESMIKLLNEVIEKRPDLTIKLDIESSGGEFSSGRLFAYGERLETPEEVELRLENAKRSCDYELEQARLKYEGLLSRSGRNING